MTTLLVLVGLCVALGLANAHNKPTEKHADKHPLSHAGHHHAVAERDTDTTTETSDRAHRDAAAHDRSRPTDSGECFLADLF